MFQDNHTTEHQSPYVHYFAEGENTKLAVILQNCYSETSWYDHISVSKSDLNDNSSFCKALLFMSRHVGYYTWINLPCEDLLDPVTEICMYNEPTHRESILSDFSYVNMNDFEKMSSGSKMDQLGISHNKNGTALSMPSMYCNQTWVIIGPHFSNLFWSITNTCTHTIRW